MAVPVSIVIPTWNGRHLLEEFLPAVIAAAEDYAARSGARVEILVVDDGSTDGTAAWIATQDVNAAAPIRVVRLDENLGFGAACNRGVREATSPLVWVLNNDVAVDRNAITHLSEPFEALDTTLFAVHSQMVDPALGRPVGTGKMGGFSRGFLRVHRSFVPKPGATGPFWSMFATGGSAMFHRRHFLDLGGFDPIFAPFYFEDVELSYRAWKRGFTVAYQPRSAVHHRFSSTIGTLDTARVDRISQRNRLIFQWIHLHDRRFVAAHFFWLAVLVATAPLTFKWRFLGAFTGALRRWPAVRARRRKERAAATRSDRGVLRVFTALEASGKVRAYGDPAELDR